MKTWLIFGGVMLAWFLFVGLGLHKWLVNAGLHVVVVILIWLILSVALALVMWYFMVPKFNILFYNKDNGITEEEPIDNITPE